MKKIKIIFVHGFLDVGGAEELRLTVLKYFDKRKYEPTVCSLSSKGDIGKEIEKLGIRVIALNQSQDIYNLKTLYSLYKLFKKEKPDIIETCMFNSSFHGIIAGKLAGIKYVFAEIHGLDHFKKWYHKEMDRLLFKYVDKIIVCSAFVKEFIAEKERIPRKKLQPILNVINPEKFNMPLDKRNRKRLKKELGIKKNQKVIGIIGRIHVQKGHIYLLKALREIKKNFPDILLLIIGIGPLEKKLKKFCELNGLQNNVKFLGVRRDLYALLRLMNLTILPSISEGFGIVILESLYCKIPCIASNVTGIPETMKNIDHGYLIPSRNPKKLAKAIIKLLENPKLAKKMGKKGHKWVTKKFMPERYVNSLDKLYTEALLN